MNHFILTVSSKGQVTLPAELRQKLGIETGTKLTLAVDDAGEVRLRKSKSLLELAGSMAHVGRELGRPLTQDDIDAAITVAVGEKEARSRR
ncbi:AbrB/MazE/SpoVT family DNA-binding domain-containing protein [Siculibacillus lacustris]|uniref:AbrB/MazE/SpoVT family DNA-binding domain-containing protein n=1 Tax=Siculibacillus lacustris TaxID=1549641 RepID=A0A4Q9VH91_9HYPH|nr:AbrB/MazE/SpoVT family DNA-binding domain-containing protein [Siculibacillus lacustris]TBW33946.1 AbrB/MazE/SpoVT family DNA-binding domain-containing protein [Siculibacillus lacustris]